MGSGVIDRSVRRLCPRRIQARCDSRPIHTPGRYFLTCRTASREPLARSRTGILSDGVTDALITDLAKIVALRVVSRTSVMPYKRTQKSLPEIARELDVET